MLALEFPRRVWFRGETIPRHQIVELKTDYSEIPVQVGHDSSPNFRLAMAAMDGRDLRSATKDFTVERELKVTVKPLHDAFLSGEEAKVEIAVTDQAGQPVEAELSLALVNEALFAVCPDSVTPILDFFQKKLPARGRTGHRVHQEVSARLPSR